MSWTVVGARGFIGSVLVQKLRRRGDEVMELTHEEARACETDLGDVLYASGVAWGAERRSDDAVRMHVEVPAALLQKRLASLTYLSSTRVYGDSEDTSESSRLRPAQSDVYAATKAAGEDLVLGDERPGMRVVRLSNVFGRNFSSGLMLSDFLRQAATTGTIRVRSSQDSEKDHVSVEDVADVVLRIAESGTHRLYNVAAGRNTRQGDVLDAIARASGCTIDVAPNAPAIKFSPIEVQRIREEFDFMPKDVVAEIPALWQAFRAHFTSPRFVTSP